MNATGSIAQVSTMATHAAVSAWAIANAFLIALIIFAILLIFAWRFGRGALVALLIALYAAYAPYLFFPYTSILPTSPALTAFLAHAGLYAAMAVVFYLIIRRIISPDFFSIGTIGLCILAALGACFIVALGAQAFSANAVYQFTPTIAALFVPSQYFFWWFIGPAVGMFIFVR